jgi:hypothetical protein
MGFSFRAGRSAGRSFRESDSFAAPEHDPHNPALSEESPGRVDGELNAGGSITPPIGDILLVAHGLETGNYYLPLSSTMGSPADFEQARAADNSDAIRIPAAVVTSSGGGGMNTITVRMRGCNTGKAKPFIEKMQKAMTPSGGSLNVTAPLHFDEFHDIHAAALSFWLTNSPEGE